MVKRKIASLQTRPIAASFLFALSALLFLSGCAEDSVEVSFNGATMGTSYTVKYVDVDGVDADKVAANVGELLVYLDASMSTYQEQSELNRLNAAAIGEPFAVSSAMWQVLLIAQQVFTLTEGAFDPTVGPLVDLWGFGPVDTQDRVPAQKDIDALMVDVGFDHLTFLPATQSVQKIRDIRIDLSAIAKGYAVARVGDLLVDMGVKSFMVEVGGELRLAGLNGAGLPWRIAVEVPNLAHGEIQKVLSVTDIGLATSGDYRNYFEKDGVRYSHEIDPRTGRPVSHDLVSVTVLVDDATQADALATAFMVMGQQATLALAERNKVAVFMLTRKPGGFAESSSSAFAPYLKEVR